MNKPKQPQSEGLVEIAFQGGPNEFGRIYRAVIQSIIPAALLTSPDLPFTEIPNPIRLVSGPPPWRKPLWCLLHAFWGDCYTPVKDHTVRLRYALRQLDGQINAESIPHLETAAQKRDRRRKNGPVIYVGDRNALEVLCHETMHHIQYWLLSEHQDIYHRFRIEMLRQSEPVGRLHKSLPSEFGYCINDVFDYQPGAYGVWSFLAAPDDASAQVEEDFKRLNDEVAVQREHDEIACMLLDLHAQGNKEATSILAHVFTKVGLRKDFELAEAWAIQADGLIDRRARRRIRYAYSLLLKGEHSTRLASQLKDNGIGPEYADRVAQDALLLWKRENKQMGAAGLALMAPGLAYLSGSPFVERIRSSHFWFLPFLVGSLCFVVGSFCVFLAAERTFRVLLIRAGSSKKRER